MCRLRRIKENRNRKKQNNEKKRKRKKETKKKNASESRVEVAQRAGEPRRARFRGVVARGDARRVGRAGDSANEKERRQRARAKERACASRKGPGSRRLKFFLKENPFYFLFTAVRWGVANRASFGFRSPTEKKGQRRPQKKEKKSGTG